jgi:hypothetical protein
MRTQCGGESKQRDYHETGNEQPLHQNLRLARNAEWLAPSDYNQRLQADVICLTYPGFVFSGVSRFYRVSGPAMYGPVVNDQASSSATATVTSAMKIRVSTGDISRVGPSENPPETGRFVDRSAARARPLNA